MKKLLLPFLFCLHYALPVQATHLMGGDITVQDLGNGQHLLTLITYRDTVGIPMQTAATFNITGPNGISMTRTTAYDSIISGNLLPMYPYGVELYFYSDTITFPGPGMWHISWENCCRNAAIRNLSNPLGESMYLQTQVEIDSTAANSTAFFLVPAAIYLPVNTQWQYNPLPFDPDGDSLSWKIDVPLDDFNTPCAGYVRPASNPTNLFRIDSVTGTISWTAKDTGNYVASILVDQYRNGRWIGEIRRDMQFIVVNAGQGHPYWLNVNGNPFDTSQVNHQLNFNLNAGSPFQFTMVASHTNPSKPLYMEAYSPLFEDPQSGAQFVTSPTGNGHDLSGTFSWTPGTQHMQKPPHLVVLRSSDGFFTDDKSIALNVSGPIGINEHGLAQELSIYPNPAQGKAFLKFNATAKQSIAIAVLSVSGQLVREYQVAAINGQNIIGMPLEDLISGTYIVKVTTENGAAYHQKLILE